MTQLNFESKEVEEYYRKMRRELGMSHPGRWNNKPCITKEDVDNYVKDAKNILACGWRSHPKGALLFPCGQQHALHHNSIYTAS